MNGSKFAVVALIVIVLLFLGVMWHGQSGKDGKTPVLSGDASTASFPGLTWIGDHLLTKQRWTPPNSDVSLGPSASCVWTVDKSGAYIRTTTIKVIAGSARVEYVPKDSTAVPVRTDLQPGASLNLQLMRQGGTLTLINKLASPATVHVE